MQCFLMQCFLMQCFLMQCFLMQCFLMQCFLMQCFRVPGVSFRIYGATAVKPPFDRQQGAQGK